VARVCIGPLGEADAPDLIAANKASAAFHAPWVEPFTDQAGFEAWRAVDPRRVSLLARTEADGAVIGLFNLSQIAMGNFCSAYLGFYASQAQSGRGLMAEALGLVLAHAFFLLGLHRVEANIQPGNRRSLALVRGAGFRQEGFSPRYLKIQGEWRDHERWAMLAEDFAAP